jgi:hypothetical protein
VSVSAGLSGESGSLSASPFCQSAAPPPDASRPETYSGMGCIHLGHSIRTAFLHVAYTASRHHQMPSNTLHELTISGQCFKTTFLRMNHQIDAVEWFGIRPK